MKRTDERGSTGRAFVASAKAVLIILLVLIPVPGVQLVVEKLKGPRRNEAAEVFRKS